MNLEALYARYYYSVPGFVDGTKAFHALCARFIAQGVSVLEIGAGKTNATSEFLASRGAVVGVDISDDVFENRWLTEAHVYNGRDLPFPDACFAACVSNYVIEHIQDPNQHLCEVRRILKPGGIYCFRTPNLWHYVAFSAKVTPHWLHLRVANRLRGLPDRAPEPHRTAYRANTKKRIIELAAATGLSVESLDMIEKEPSYGRAAAFLFFPMLAYERLVNSSNSLSILRANILCGLRKPG